MYGDYADIFEKHFSFWTHLTDSQKKLLCDKATIVNYKKGTSISSGDNDCTGVVIILKGQIRTYMLSEDGREITLYRLYEGDTCMLSASCVLDAITFDVFTEAHEDSTILLIDSSLFNKLKNTNPYVEAFAYKVATMRFSDVMWTMQQILFMRADQRLAIFLWDEAVKTKTDIIKMTHEAIAKNIGSAREVVSRMLKYFSDEGIVAIERGRVKIIDRDKLRSLI